MQLCCNFQQYCNRVATCELQLCCKLHHSCNKAATHMLQLCCNIDSTPNTIATRMLQLWWWNSQRMCNEYIPPHGLACLQHMQRYVCGYLHGILIAASVQPPCSSRPSLLYNYVMGTSCSPGAMQLMQHITNGLLNGSDVGF